MCSMISSAVLFHTSTLLRGRRWANELSIVLTHTRLWIVLCQSHALCEWSLVALSAFGKKESCDLRPSGLVPKTFTLSLNTFIFILLQHLMIGEYYLPGRRQSYRGTLGKTHPHFCRCSLVVPMYPDGPADIQSRVNYNPFSFFKDQSCIQR